MNTSRPLTAFLAIAFMICAITAGKATVVTYIDYFTTTQTLGALNSSTNSTIASAAAIGGYRTFSLTSTDNDPDLGNTIMRVSTNAPIGPRFSLSTPTDATSSFEIKWGGANGTSGLGGVDLRGGIAATNFSLTSSTINFLLRSADLVSAFTWTFTDTGNNIASYSANFPTHSSTNPAIPYAISLASFTGAGTVDWSSINFITLSGGGLELDLSLSPPITFTAQPIPEPGTWAAAGLLLIAAGYIRWRRSRSAQEQEAPAAA